MKYTCIFCGEEHAVGYLCPHLKNLVAEVSGAKPDSPVSAPGPVTPPPAAAPTKGPLSNIQADGNIPVCPLHKQPMDRLTSKNIPYHSYKGKNCSGEGWWGSPKQS